MLSNEARFLAAINSLSEDIFNNEVWPFNKSASGIFTIKARLEILFIINPNFASLHFAMSGNSDGDITYISWKLDLYKRRINQMSSEGKKTTSTKK